MMDVDEFGESTSCVILSLMGVDDRLRKKLIREHTRVLSDEYHQRVASMDSHDRRSSFMSYSFGASQNCENIEASAAIGQKKRCKKAIHNEEEMSDVVSLEKKASGGTGLVDELLSGIYFSRITPRHYPSLDNSSKALSNLRARFSRKRSLSSSYTDYKYDWFSARLGSCLPKSQFSVVSTDRRVKGGENVASEPTAESEDAVGKVHVQAENGEVRLPGNPNMPGVPTSCVTLKRNYSHYSPANISVDATELICEAEQETSSYDSEDSFSTNRSSIETDSFKSFEDEYLRSPDSVLESFYEEKSSSDIIAKLSEQGTRFNSFGFDPSTAWSGEIQTTGLSDATCEDQCEDGPTIQDNDLRPARIGESREFHYLVEILTKAGFCRTNLMSSLDKWHTLESPMSPFVFEMVEKRYTDNKSWEVSDRVLLFDRMNSCLEGILRGSTLNPSRHVRARNSDRFHCDVDEEALWRSLIKEGKELKGETIEDLLERDLRSLDLAEFIESVVVEIEWSVIDVLAAELVNDE